MLKEKTNKKKTEEADYTLITVEISEIFLLHDGDVWIIMDGRVCS